MADDGVLLLSTKVDLSGANELAAGVSAAMAKVITAQREVSAQSKALSEVEKELGQAAAAGSAQAKAAIEEELQALVAKQIALQSAKEAVKALRDSEEEEVETEVKSVSARQAATASLSLAEGRMMGANRAAGTFLATTLGLGPVLQAAFPVIGALALVDVLSQIPKAFDKMEDAIAGWNAAREKAFKEAITEADHVISQYESVAKTQAELNVPAELIGPAKINADINALGEYQQSLDGLNSKLVKVKAALDAAKETQTFIPEGGEGGIPIQIPAFSGLADKGDEVKAQVKQQLDDLNALLTKFATEHNRPIPIPLTVDFSTSAGTVESQLDTVLAATRKNIEDIAAKQDEANLGKKGKASTGGAEEAREEVAAGEARLAARRRADDAIVALDEATQKHLLETGQIGQAQEVAALEVDSQKKLDIQIKYLEAVNAAKAAQDTKEGKAPELDTSIIANLGEIEALKAKGRADDIAGADAVRNAQIKALTDATNAQIEQIKSVPGATVQAELEADQQVLTLRRQLYTDIAAAGAASTEQGRAAFKAQEDAQRTLAEAEKKASDEATQHQLENLEKVEAAEEKADAAGAKRAEDDIARQTKQAQAGQAYVYKEQTSQPFESGGEKIGAAQSNADALTAIAQKSADQQLAIVQSTATKEAQLLLANIPVFTEAFTAGTLSADQYGKKVTEVLARVSEVAQAAATKQTQISDTEANEETRIQEQLLQTYLQVKQQEEAAITGFVTSATSELNQFAVTIATTIGEVNGKISESRYIGEQFNKLWIDLERGFLQMVLKMLEDTTLFKGFESMIEGAFSKAFSVIPGLSKAAIPGAPTLSAEQAVSLNPTATASAAATATGSGQQAAQETAASASLDQLAASAKLSSTALTQSHAATVTDVSATQASATAKTTDTTATHASAAATTIDTAQTRTSSAATTIDTAATHASVASTTINSSSTTANTAATTINTVSTHGNTAAHTVNAAALWHSTTAHLVHAEAVLGSTVAHIGHAIAVAASTLAAWIEAAARAAATLVGASTGGLIQGPGSGTSDSIPLNVSHGEYVVKADSVSKPGMLEHLHSINTGKIAPVPRKMAEGGFVDGGMVGPRRIAMALGGLADATYDNGLGTSKGGGSTFGGDMNTQTINQSTPFHYHAGNVSALDAAGVGEVLNRGRGDLTKIVKSAIARGQINPRQLMRGR
jgi:hypothetical protein